MKNSEIIKILKKNNDESVKLRKFLCEKMPYLIPKYDFLHCKKIKNYDYSFINGEYDIPETWFSLFLQMCEDIREPLIKNNELDKFEFEQIKEKFGAMRIYSHGCSQNILDIIKKYEYLSNFICVKCGKKANRWSLGYILPYCENCLTEEYEDFTPNVDFVMRYKYYTSNEGYKNVEIDCNEEWNKYSSDSDIYFT